jgi:cytochrome c oxidase cbb3-type subunit 2
MPAYPWLDRPISINVGDHMKALRVVGLPYTDDQIANAATAVSGKTELDALIAYLQGLGLAFPSNAPK